MEKLIHTAHHIISCRPALQARIFTVFTTLPFRHNRPWPPLKKENPAAACDEILGGHPPRLPQPLASPNPREPFTPRAINKMSKFLQLCFASFAVVAAVVFEASANEAAISDDYYYDYDLYSYDDVVDALYSDQGKEHLCSPGIRQTLILGTDCSRGTASFRKQTEASEEKEEAKGSKATEAAARICKGKSTGKCQGINSNQQYLVAI